MLSSEIQHHALASSAWLMQWFKTWPTVQSSGARIPQEATTCTVMVSYWYGYDTSFAA